MEVVRSNVMIKDQTLTLLNDYRHFVYLKNLFILLANLLSCKLFELLFLLTIRFVGEMCHNKIHSLFWFKRGEGRGVNILCYYQNTISKLHNHVL